MNFKKLRKFFVPAVALALIINANTSKKDSYEGVFLWSGVYSGMTPRQVKKVLGGDVECMKIDEEPYCKRRNPSVPLGGEKAVAGVKFQNKKVSEVVLLVINANECNGVFDEEKCLDGLKHRDRETIRSVKNTLTSKYGPQVALSVDQNWLKYRNRTFIDYGWLVDGALIEVVYQERGLWYVRYTEDKTAL